MRRLGVLVVAVAVLAVGTGSGLAYDSHAELPLADIGTEIIPVVDSVEYLESWAGGFDPTMTVDTFRWDTRVGFRITKQYPGSTAGPDLTGYGFTYGTATLINEYWNGQTRPPMEAKIWAVEDPTSGYDGYYGRVWGVTPEFQGTPAQPFEGTIKFVEDGEKMTGEVVLIRDVGSQGTYECYGRPLPLAATRTSGQSVRYQGTMPMAVYDDQKLAGTVAGTMNGSVGLKVDSVRLGGQPDPTNAQSQWSFVRPADGFSVGEAVVPDEVGNGRTWLVIQRHPEISNVDTYDGMFQAYENNGNSKMPAFTVDGEFSFATYTFTGITEQLINQPGDLNGDETVNSGDLDIVRANWGAQTLSGQFLKGDPSRNAQVTSGDLDIIRANWGATAAASAVPEPGILALLFGAALAVTGFRRR